MTQDLSDSNMDLDEFVGLTLENLELNASGLTIHWNERLSINGGQYHRLIFSASQMGYQLFFFQSITMVNSKAYFITFTGLDKNYEPRKNVANYILDSFKVFTP